MLLLPQWMPGDAGSAPDALVAAVPASPGATAVRTSPGIVPVVVASEDEPAATYTTPPLAADPAVALPSPQLASYLVAHSEYTLPLTRRNVVLTAPGQDAPADPARGRDEREQDEKEVK